MREEILRRYLIPLVLLAIAIAVNACASDPPDSSPASGLLDPNGNVVLYVSNQSFAIDSIDVTVEIDGEEVISEDFDVGDQHNWKQFVIRLAPGHHTLRARSRLGDATLEKSFVVSDKHWAVLNYWYSTEEYGHPPEPKQFEFIIQDKPVTFAARDGGASVARS